MTNRAFEELQKRCRVMNIKRYLKVLLFMFLIIAIVLFGYFEFFQSQKINKKTIKSIKKIKVPKKIVKKKLEPKKSETQKYDTILLSPTINIPDMSNKTITQSIKKAQFIEQVKPKKIEVQKKIVKKRNIFIKVKSFEDEKSLIKANSDAESFDTTLALSKFYYKKQKYEKAITWSKKANHYNPSSFDPWLIYAQAKIKQGKKDEAIRAVETFLSYFSSEEANKFLSDIRKTK